jgi:hypothetical protein
MASSRTADFGWDKAIHVYSRHRMAAKRWRVSEIQVIEDTDGYVRLHRVDFERLVKRKKTSKHQKKEQEEPSAKESSSDDSSADEASNGDQENKDPEDKDSIEETNGRVTRMRNYDSSETESEAE